MKKVLIILLSITCSLSLVASDYGVDKELVKQLAPATNPADRAEWMKNNPDRIAQLHKAENDMLQQKYGKQARKKLVEKQKEERAKFGARPEDLTGALDSTLKLVRARTIHSQAIDNFDTKVHTKRFWEVNSKYDLDYIHGEVLKNFDEAHQAWRDQHARDWQASQLRVNPENIQATHQEDVQKLLQNQAARRKEFERNQKRAQKQRGVRRTTGETEEGVELATDITSPGSEQFGSVEDLNVAESREREELIKKHQQEREAVAAQLESSVLDELDSLQQKLEGKPAAQRWLSKVRKKVKRLLSRAKTGKAKPAEVDVAAVALLRDDMSEGENVGVPQEELTRLQIMLRRIKSAFGTVEQAEVVPVSAQKGSKYLPDDV